MYWFIYDGHLMIPITDNLDSRTN